MLAGEDLVDAAPERWSEQSEKANRHQQGDAFVAPPALLVFANIQGSLADGAPGSLGDGKADARVQSGKRLDQLAAVVRAGVSIRENRSGWSRVRNS